MTKKDLKAATKQAYKLATNATGLIVAFYIYADSTYPLDTEEDNIIEICKTQQEAEELVKGINDESNFKAAYYKPILIDEDSGERINREKYKSYEKI